MLYPALLLNFYWNDVDIIHMTTNVIVMILTTLYIFRIFLLLLSALYDRD